MLDAKWTRRNALYNGTKVSNLQINKDFYINFKSNKLLQCSALKTNT